MRVAYLIAGAGGMYCGSCLRDNRIAATLIARGREVVLIPLYTPIRTDESDVSRGPVHYGGLSVFLDQKSAVFRRLPFVLRRWLDAAAVLRLATRFAVRTSPADLGALTVAMLEHDSRIHGRHFERLLAELRGLDADLVHLPNLLFAGMVAPLKAALQVPVVCTLAGEDVFLDALPEPHRGRACELISAAAAAVDGFIAPTRYYASAMIERFGLPGDRVHHVPLGVHCGEAPCPGPPPERPFVVGYLARIAPEKGLAELGDAVLALRRSGRDCVLRAAGTLPAQHRGYLREVRTRFRGAGEDVRFEYVGEVDHEGKRRFLAGLHCLSVPGPYPEAKGLYVLESLAACVPVVLPRRGACTELVEQTAGGVLYDPDSHEGLAASLAALMDDSQRRADLGRRGRAAVCTAHTAEAMADAAWGVFEACAGRGERRC